MAIRSLSQVTCSLNLGLIYNVDYSYSPDNGSSITLFVVNENGVYSHPAKMQKANISIGNASFTLYCVASSIELSNGRRVMSVEFVDDTFRLNNYQVVLTGKGRGYNIYELGSPVDNRSASQKLATAIDRTAQQIKEFTQFPDIEYSFDDFLSVLRRNFNVSVSAAYPKQVSSGLPLTNTFTGTFREVLDNWCSFYGLSWFVENSSIKIFNPSTINISLPAQPPEAISYSSTHDIRSTYAKTCYNWFQQEGGEFPLNQTNDKNGPLSVRTNTLYPLGYDFGLPQTNVNLKQVAAAQLGQEFWFLYNYNLGTAASECGWTPNASASSSIYTTVKNIAGPLASIATFDQNAFNNKYQMYQQYGQQIAGRWYLGPRQDTVAIDEEFTWFNEADGQILTFNNKEADKKQIQPLFLIPTTLDINQIPNTAINEYFTGINFIGQRMAYQDTAPLGFNLALTTGQQYQINNLYQSIFEIQGSASLDFSELSSYPNTFVGYSPVTIPQDLINDVFNRVETAAETLKPRYTSIPIKGISNKDYSTLKSSQEEGNDVSIVTNGQGGNVIANTAIIKTLKQGSYSVYYDKYSQYASANSAGNYFQHRFEPRQISIDNAITISLKKTVKNTYQLNRDFSIISQLVNNPTLSELCQARSFPTQKVSYTVNYFENVPSNFLTNGLVGLSVSIGDNGVTATYSYSNEVVQVPYPELQYAELEQQIRNSAIRKYQPTTVIS